MSKARISRLLLVIGMISFTAEGLFGGVGQVRSANSINTQTYANRGYSNSIYSGYGSVVVGDYYNDYDGWAGTAPGSMEIPMGTILEYAPSSAVPVMVKGNRFYYENNIYLAEVYDGSSVVYQVVPAPLGAVVQMLPAGCRVQNYNGKSFTVCGSTIYQQVAGGYEVVALN